MEVVLYAARVEAAVVWRISLDRTLRTDWAYWLRRNPSVRLWRHVSLLPYGKAVAMLEKKVPLSPLLSRLQEVQMDATEGLAIPDDAITDKLANAMEGRALLTEEFVSLVDFLAGEKTDTYWTSLAQWGYLNGWIQLDQSVRV